ncbi:hypothetical protein BY458DRAFT_504387 [Sporodiniella umbellata]|nr:hypothetical protein BY458DRAFT_504387 [Sporodiniella umbellata]
MHLVNLNRKEKGRRLKHSFFSDVWTKLAPTANGVFFSMAIPGRVGYQCANDYRFLIASGTWVDPNYSIDPQGKPRYLFQKKTTQGTLQHFYKKHTKNKQPFPS